MQVLVRLSLAMIGAYVLSRAYALPFTIFAEAITNSLSHLTALGL